MILFIWVFCCLENQHFASRNKSKSLPVMMVKRKSLNKSWACIRSVRRDNYFINLFIDFVQLSFLLPWKFQHITRRDSFKSSPIQNVWWCSRAKVQMKVELISVQYSEMLTQWLTMTFVANAIELAIEANSTNFIGFGKSKKEQL